MHFRTYQDLSAAVISSLPDIPSDVDLIVGVPRSGLLAASYYSLLLNLPLTTVDLLLKGEMLPHGTTKTTESWISSVYEARQILVVEDSVSSGKSIQDCRRVLESSEFSDKVIYLAVYVVPEAMGTVDYHVEVLPQPRMFEWNFLTHAGLERCCFDIDGVICPDPLPEQNDDGDKYLSFIKNAPMKLKPLNKVGYIVTSRLERYRAETDQWLRDNDISYKRMFMHEASTAEERRELDNHARYKALVYKGLNDAELFIESDDDQAREIFALAGKPVFCVETQTFYHDSVQEAIHIKRAHKQARFKKIARRLLPQSVYSSLKRTYYKIKAR